MAISDILKSDAKVNQQVRSARNIDGVVITPKMQAIIDKSKGSASSERKSAMMTQFKMTADSISQEAKDKAKALQEQAERMKKEQQ